MLVDLAMSRTCRLGTQSCHLMFRMVHRLRVWKRSSWFRCLLTMIWRSDSLCSMRAQSSANSASRTVFFKGRYLNYRKLPPGLGWFWHTPKFWHTTANISQGGAGGVRKTSATAMRPASLDSKARETAAGQCGHSCLPSYGCLQGKHNRNAARFVGEQGRGDNRSLVAGGHCGHSCPLSNSDGPASLGRHRYGDGPAYCGLLRYGPGDPVGPLVHPTAVKHPLWWALISHTICGRIPMPQPGTAALAPWLQPLSSLQQLATLGLAQALSARMPFWPGSAPQLPSSGSPLVPSTGSQHLGGAAPSALGFSLCGSSRQQAPLQPGSSLAQQDPIPPPIDHLLESLFLGVGMGWGLQAGLWWATSRPAALVLCCLTGAARWICPICVGRQGGCFSVSGSLPYSSWAGFGRCGAALHLPPWFAQVGHGGYDRELCPGGGQSLQPWGLFWVRSGLPRGFPFWEVCQAGEVCLYKGTSPLPLGNPQCCPAPHTGRHAPDSWEVSPLQSSTPHQHPQMIAHRLAGERMIWGKVA